MGIISPTEAAERLRRGEVVAIPTETVYGLAADATLGPAVRRIFAAKGRPDFNPLISHIGAIGQLDELAIADARARALAAAFWPGPLTLVLPRSPACPVVPEVSAGLPSLAIRMPGHPVAQEILHQVAKPLAAPSANRSGHVSPTCAAHVLESLGPSIPVVDGGSCRLGLESTVIGLTGPDAVLLRAGSITPDEIAAVIGAMPVPPQDARLQSPGQMLKHYAPSLPLRLDAMAPRGREGLLGFGPPPPGFAEVFSLSDTGDLVEAAARLYAGLHALDHAGLEGIAAMPIPHQGIGIAINDRLTRAARGR